MFQEQIKMVVEKMTKQKLLVLSIYNAKCPQSAQCKLFFSYLALVSQVRHSSHGNLNPLNLMSQIGRAHV